MGRNADEKEVKLTFWNGFYDIGYRILDFVTIGSLSKSAKISKLKRDIANSMEREIKLANRVVSFDNAHEREKIEWAKRLGIQEAENEKLVYRLSDTNKKVKRLEGKVAEADGALILARNELEEVKDVYTRAQAIIDSNPELEGAMADFEKYYAQLGIEGAEFGKNALSMVRRSRAFVKIAYEKVEEAKGEVREAERKSVLGRAYVRLEKKKAIFVLDEKHRVEAMSPAAQRLIGHDITGRDASYITSRLGLMIGYVAPTLEESLSVRVNSVGNLENARINVSFERYYGQHIGSFLVVDSAPWYQVMVRKTESVYKLVAHSDVEDSFGNALTKMVNQAVIPDGNKRIAIDLRSTVRMSDEIAKRIGGLAQSNYFKNKMNIILSHGNVYDQLIRYGVPEEIIFGEYEKEGGLEGTLVPGRA